ncbi:MAG: hypothetical protein HZA12_06420 [Nitrospirae bacterium]|nr:hypothetical protein [Nitrospirota bacterium]
MKAKLLILGIILSLFLPIVSYARDIPFTQEDRDRLIRLEVKVDGLDKRIDDIRDSFRNQFDDIRSTMRWGFGVLFSGMMSLIGFVLWDRRSAIAPVIRKNKELEEREEKLEKALKEIAPRPSPLP